MYHGKKCLIAWSFIEAAMKDPFKFGFFFMKSSTQEVLRLDTSIDALIIHPLKYMLAGLYS